MNAKVNISKTESAPNNRPNRARRVAATIAGLALAGVGIFGVAESHNRYGYNPSQNNPPTYMDTHKGINPADIHQEVQR